MSSAAAAALGTLSPKPLMTCSCEEQTHDIDKRLQPIAVRAIMDPLGRESPHQNGL